MLGPELMARLSGGMVCRLEPAEYATRLGIVRQVAERPGLDVPDGCAAFIASHFTTQARELAGALKRLQATSLAHERPITLALAEEALAELIDHSRPRRQAGRHRAGRVRRVRPGARKPAIGRQGQGRQPSADAGHVAGPQAHAGRA